MPFYRNGSYFGGSTANRQEAMASKLEAINPLVYNNATSFFGRQTCQP